MYGICAGDWNPIEGNNLALEKPELNTKEQGNVVPDTDFNLQESDEQDVKNHEYSNNADIKNKFEKKNVRTTMKMTHSPKNS